MYLDRKPTFSQHVHTRVAAVQRAFLALCRLAHYETGLSPTATRQLHQACVTSRSDFGAEIWWNRQKNLERMLQLQQNRALWQILNAFTSTPIIALHNEAAIQLVSVRLDQKQWKYALHLLSLPPTHPVAQRCPAAFPIPNLIDAIPDISNEYDYDWQTTARPPSRLATALWSLVQWVQPYDIVESTMQQHPDPWILSPIATDICGATKPDATRAHTGLLNHLRRDTCSIIAYTDGSQLGTATGAGYTIPTGFPEAINAIVPMGNTSEVFDAELRAVYECLLTCRHYARIHHLHRHHIHIFSDNQAAITHSASLDRGTGQEIAALIRDMTLALRPHVVQVTVHWVPGHTGIPGNKKADMLAKLVTERQPTIRIPISTSWLRCHIREQTAIEWQQCYDGTPRPMTYATPHRCRLDSAYTTLPRKISSAILGLRTGYGYFLDCLACRPSDKYPSRHCGCPLHRPQMPKHLLLSCPDLRDQRMTLRWDLKLHRNARLNVLTILHSPAGTKALSDFISATKNATAEWAHTRLSMIPAAEDNPASLTIGWGTLLENREEHEDEQGDED
jgi:ribonuclease HI